MGDRPRPESGQGHRQDPYRIGDPAELDRLYGEVARASRVKETDHIHPIYRPFIEAASFLVLTTAGSAGLDASPRGDPAGFVHVEDDRTLLLPDRRGNNRIDSLRNILSDPRVGLLFLIPGIGESIRVKGRAEITVAPDLLDRFAVDGQRPRSILRIAVERVYFQCSRAAIRARLWDAAQHIDRSQLPSTGSILAALSEDEIDGRDYDRRLPDRLTSTLY